jgi:hypothetical protein
VPSATRLGILLIRTDTLLPKAVEIDSEPYASGWRRVTNVDGYELGRQVHAAGWTFFFRAGGLKSITFGRDLQETTGRAVTQILDRLTSSKYNSLEITRVTSKSLWGVSCSSISAHSRHIQESPFLFRTKEAAV